MASPLKWLGVLLGGGAGGEILSTERGAANTVLAVASTDAKPAFTGSPTISSLTVATATITGNATVGGTLGVTGASTFTGAVQINDTLSIQPDAGVVSTIEILPNADDSSTGTIRFFELAANGSQRVSIRAPNLLTASTAFILPAADGTANLPLLTNGGGALFFGQIVTAAIADANVTPAKLSVLPKAIMQFISVTAVAAGSTRFLGRTDAGTENPVAFVCPVTGHAVRMETRSDGTPGGTETYIYTLRIANADTAIATTVTGAAGQGSSTGSVAVTAGDRIAVKLVTSAGATANQHQVAVAIAVEA